MIEVPALLKPIDNQQLETPEPPPSNVSPLAAAAGDFTRRQGQDFVHSMETVATINPDSYAKATAVSRYSGIEPKVLHDNSDRMNQLLRGNEYAAIYENFRKTANALRDGNMAAISQDDLDQLTRIEGAASDTRFNQQSTGEKLWGAVKQQWTAMRQATNIADTSNLLALADDFDAVDAEIARASEAGEQPFSAGGAPEGFGGEYLRATPDQRIVMRQNLQAQKAEQLASAAADEQALAEMPVDPGARRAAELQAAGQGSLAATAEALAENPGYAVRSAVGAGATSAPMLLAGAIGGPVAAGAIGFGTEYDAKLLDVLREAGVDPADPKSVIRVLQDDALMSDAERRAALKATGTTAVDLISMGLASRLLVPSRIAGRQLTTAQRELANLAVQFPVQGISEGAGEAAGQLLAEGEVDAGEVLLETVAGAGMSSLDVLAFSNRRLIEQLGDGLRRARETRAGTESLGEMVDAATNSKTRGRDRETFRNIADQQLKDSPMETLWLPVEALQQLNQSGQANLPELLQEVPGLAQQYADAVARGGSVSMKTADYLAVFADYHDQLGQSVRINVDGMSPADMEAWTTEQEEQLDALAEQLRTLADPARETLNEIVGQLVGSGFRRADAEQYAATHLSVLQNLGERTGLGLEGLRQRFQLDIGTQAPEQLRAVTVDDARLAIQRLRAGDIPQPSDMFGQSLREYLVASGGVSDEGGELAAIDADVGKVGRNRLARKAGKSLNQAAMDAWEHGYFPGVPREDVGPQLIIDAVQRELAGDPVFSAEQENATLRDQAETLRQLQEFIDRLDVDITEMSDDEVLALLQGQGEPVDGQRLEQSKRFSEDNRLSNLSMTGPSWERIRAANKALAKVKSADELVTIYRATVGNEIRPDDFVAVSRDVAEMELENVRDRDAAGEIIEQRVQVRDLLMGNDATEFVYFPEQRLEQAGEEDARGFITFAPRGEAGEQRRFQITLGEKRDLTTLLHELGHFYLEVLDDVAAGENAPEQIARDIATVRKWVGAEQGQPLTVEQHEQFARGFESYLAEGKAPNPDLAGAFARFKRWLIGVYKDLRRLNVELNDDVRRVFDRLVATDEQITAAEQVSNAIPLFADAQAAGMTDAEFAAYQDSLAVSHSDAQETVEREVQREEDRRRSKFWREESGRVRQEVTEEVDTLPEYAAMRALRRGEMPDGTTLNIKMNSAELTERYGASVARRLAFTHSRAGQPLDVVAPMLGYESGDQLVKAMLGAVPRGQLIARETEQRMLERHGPKSTGEAAERALDAVHNERRADVLQKELTALGKAGNRRQITSQQILKEAARRVMAERKVRDIQPAEYQRAEAKAAREAFDAARRGNLDAAYEAKQRQLLNFYLYREARKARESVDAIVERMAKYNKRSTRERLGKAGHDYLDQVDAVMEQYEFRTVSLRDLDKRVSFRTWYEDQLARGNEPFVPEFVINNSQRTNYKDLSLDQLQELDEFVSNVNHLARTKNKLLANQRIRDFDEARTEMIRAGYSNLEKRRPPPIDKNTRSMLERIGDQAGEFSAALIKMEQVVDWLDGGQVDGPWSLTFWQPFVEAQAEKERLNREFAIKMTGLVDAYTAERGAKVMQQQTYIAGLGQSLTHNAILSAALNTGNASNRQKLLNGGHNGTAWTEQQMNEITGNLTARDWEFVQSLWDLVEELWPSIEALEKDLHGIPPEKVQPVPVVTQFGEFRGGYWPLVYDTSSSAYAGVQNQLGNEGGLFEQGYARATTPKGHTKARVDSFAAPIMLDVEIIAQHLGQVIHDLTHRKAIRDGAKIIGDKQIKQMLIDTLGPAVANQFNPWLQGVANDMVLDSQKGIDAWTRAAERLRANLAVGFLGFSATTGITQLLGYSQTFEFFSKIGAKRYVFRGLQEFIRAPWKAVEFVNSLSPEMRYRVDNLDRDMRGVLKQIAGKSDTLSIVQRLAFKHIGMIQALVDYPTWLAGYHHGLDSGLSADDAVSAGDRAVRLSQMAAGPKDLAAVQRKDGLMRALTIVYSYFNLLYNRTVDLKISVSAAKIVGDYLNAFERTMFLIAIPAIVGPLVVGQGPGDDEDWRAWAALKLVTYPLLGIPGLRDLASSLESGWAYRGATPIGELFSTLSKFRGVGARAIEGEDQDAARVAGLAIEAIGYGFGLPVAQPKRTIKFLVGVSEGEIEPEGPTDWVRGVLFGPPKE